MTAPIGNYVPRAYAVRPKTPSVRKWVWIGSANAALLDSDRLSKDQFAAFVIQCVSPPISGR